MEAPGSVNVPGRDRKALMPEILIAGMEIIRPGTAGKFGGALAYLS
jgi:hypothetical protein